MTAARANTLLRAAAIAGGIESLARGLRVPKKQLCSWMEGEVQTPRAVVVRAIEFLRCAQPVSPAPRMRQTPLQEARARAVLA